MLDDKIITQFYVENGIIFVMKHLNKCVTGEAEFYRILMCVQYLIQSILEEYQFKPFEGCNDLIDLIIEILANKEEYEEKASMMNVLQKCCDHRQVIEYIMEQQYGRYIIKYLDKLTTEEECCRFALKTIFKCVSKDSKFDDYFLDLNLLTRLVNIMKSSYANDRHFILYYCVYIIAQLIASDEKVSKEARHCLVMENIINVILLDSHASVTNVCLDSFRRYIFKAGQDEIKSFILKNMEFLEVILKFCHKDQSVKNIQICLVILNKVLGDEREQCDKDSRPFYEFIMRSNYLDNLERLQRHKDDVIFSFSSALIDEFFESTDWEME